MTYRRLVKLVDGRGGIKDPLQRVDQLRDDDVALHLGPAGGGGAKGPDDRGEHRRLGRWQIHEETKENGRSQTAKNDHGTGGKESSRGQRACVSVRPTLSLRKTYPPP